MRYRLRPTEDNFKKLLDPILTTWDHDWADAVAVTLADMKVDLRIPPLASDEDLRQLTMPTLVLAADQDISFPGRLIERRLSKVAPQIDVEIMKDCKHCPPTTPKFRNWLADRVTEFIDAPRPTASQQNKATA
jgi:2-hydroxy-6-oxonona-2,4-dienedioate hydrolase